MLNLIKEGLDLIKKCYIPIGSIAAIIIIIEAIKSFVKSSRNMGIEKTCEKIIADFNVPGAAPKLIGSAAWMYLLTDKREKYRLRKRKARRCLEYLIEKGFIYYDSDDPQATHWRRQ